MSNRYIAFWILFGVTLAVYATMLVWSLPVVSNAAGGAAPFDMRPAGYTFEDTKAFLAALSADGRAFYLDVQQRLDLFYPALLAATLFFAIVLLAPAGRGVWRWVLAATAIPGAVFDYLENHQVAAMLALGPDAVTPEMAATASRWTVLKSGFSTIAMVILLVLLATWAAKKLLARFRGRHAQ